MCSDSVFNLLKRVADASVLCMCFIFNVQEERRSRKKNRLNSTAILNSGRHTLKDDKIIKRSFSKNNIAIKF